MLGYTCVIYNKKTIDMTEEMRKDWSLKFACSVATSEIEIPTISYDIFNTMTFLSTILLCWHCVNFKKNNHFFSLLRLLRFGPPIRTIWLEFLASIAYCFHQRSTNFRNGSFRDNNALMMCLQGKPIFYLRRH